MAASDAKIIGTKGAINRWYFLMELKDGTPVPGDAANITVKFSGDAGTEATAGGTVTEAGSTIGGYYIEFDATESNSYALVGRAFSTTTDTIAPGFVLYLQASATDIRVNVETIAGATAAVPGAAGGLLIAGSNAATTIASLAVPGDFAMGTLTILGATVFAGNVDLSQNLTVTGTTTFALAAGTIAAGTFAANALDAVWSTTTRTLTAGTNIVLAKGTGITGLNDIAAGSAMTLTAAYDAAKTAATQASVNAIPTNPITDKTGFSLANGSIASATFAAGATIPRVTLADTLTTYTGNAPQTGDSFARIGATGSGLTSLAPASTALSNAVWTSAMATALIVTNAEILKVPRAGATFKWTNVSHDATSDTVSIAVP